MYPGDYTVHITNSQIGPSFSGLLQRRATRREGRATASQPTVDGQGVASPASGEASEREGRPRGLTGLCWRMRAILERYNTSALYPVEGQPAYAPWRLAVVTVLQYAENLTDRQAAHAVRERIDWKYSLGLDRRDAASGLIGPYALAQLRPVIGCTKISRAPDPCTLFVTGR